MSTLQTDEANIIDAEEVNWQWVVLPLVLLLLVAAGGFGVYYYLQMQQDAAEAEARVALLKATTPAEFLKVAEQYPKTDQAMLATFSAANASFEARDYDGAQTAYHKIIDNPALGAQWRDSASIGIASCDEGKGDADKAISEYLEVARRGDASPFAAFAFNCVARIYDARGDKKTEGDILRQAAQLNPDSPSVRRAQQLSNELNPPAQQSMTFPVGNPNAPAPAAK
jgi:predicted negative regulator of RcsB-dependent stress response